MHCSTSQILYCAVVAEYPSGKSRPSDWRLLETRVELLYDAHRYFINSSSAQREQGAAILKIIQKVDNGPFDHVGCSVLHFVTSVSRESCSMDWCNKSYFGGGRREVSYGTIGWDFSNIKLLPPWSSPPMTPPPSTQQAQGGTCWNACCGWRRLKPQCKETVSPYTVTKTPKSGKKEMHYSPISQQDSPTEAN